MSRLPVDALRPSPTTNPPQSSVRARRVGSPNQQPVRPEFEPRELNLDLPESKAPPIPPHHKPRRWFWRIALLVVVLLVGAALSVWFWYQSALQPLASVQQRIRVNIAQGATADDIGQLLERQHVIKSHLAFSWYTRLQGKRNLLQAGTYLFSPTQPVTQIIDWLVAGKVDTFNVTILPGQTLAQIKARLVNDGFSASEIDAAFAQAYDSPLLAQKPAGMSLEGYIYPDTYQVNSDTTPEQLLKRSFDEFYTQIQTAGLTQALQARGFNLHQAITLASIVQLEANTPEDRRQIAQVFEKRLSLNMMLGSDVTFIYAAKLTGQPATPDLDSPYNTRKYKGLPPGPIATITLDALTAVANPAPGDYLYFVAGDDGAIHYAMTIDEHNANVAKYCIKLCSQTQ